MILSTESGLVLTSHALLILVPKSLTELHGGGLNKVVTELRAHLPLPTAWLPVLGTSSPTLFELLRAWFRKLQPAWEEASVESNLTLFQSALASGTCLSCITATLQSWPRWPSTLMTLTLTQPLKGHCTYITSLYSHLDYWLNLVSVPKPALLTLLRYGETVSFQWGHCLCLSCCHAWIQFHLHHICHVVLDR